MSKEHRKLLAKGLALGAIFAVGLYLASVSRESEAIREFVSRFGYIGIFLVSVISGFNLAVPIPAVAFLPLFLESGLNFGWTLACIAAGVSLADLLAFYVGRFGKQAIELHQNRRMLARLQKLRARFGMHPLAALFVFICIVPLPNELLLIPLGLLGYRIVHVAPVIFIGNITFTLLYAKGLLELFKFWA